METGLHANVPCVTELCRTADTVADEELGYYAIKQRLIAQAKLA